MIDAAAFAATVRLPKGADENTTLKIRAGELLRLARIAYLQGARDAIEPLQEAADIDAPDFMKGLFGGFSSKN